MASQPAELTMHVTALRHFEAGRLAAAAAVCHAILHRAPHDWLALRMLGGIHHREGTFDQAAQYIAAALQAAPRETADIVNLLNELAEALHGKRDLAGALDCYRRALKHDQRNAVALQNSGHVLVELNHHAEALEQFRLALTVTPDSPELRHNEAIAMLALGMWPEGWERLEARLQIPRLHLIDPVPADVPHWRGESCISGKTILLHAEQGLGDTLQYVRYVPLVAEHGARVVLRVQPELRKLLAGMPGADTVVTVHDAVPDVDLHCPLMSLPLAFATTTTTVPARIPYVSVPPEYQMLWQALLGRRQRRRIGLSWSGSQHLPARSMKLATLEPLLLARADLEFHALQQEIPEADRGWLAAHPVVADHSAAPKDFADTAALISLMDIVVSIDTAVAHLAGALGKKLAIMLPYNADCRWLLDRTDTPWYPTAQLFRQQRLGDWNGVVADVALALSV